MAAVDFAARQHVRRPALADEPGWRGFRQDRRSLTVYLTQHLDGAHERGRCRHALEFERREEGRRPASDTSVVLAHLLISIERVRPGQCLSLRDGRAEPLPRNHRRDRPESILLVVMGGDQSGADACVKTHFLVDGATIRLESTGMASLGFTEHRTDQAIEQIEGLIGQAGGEIERGGDQRRMPPLPLVTRDMLRRGATGLAGKLSEACLMHTMSARGIETDRAHMIQALNQSQHRDRLRRFRHLAQPGEPGLVGFLPPV